MTCAQKLEEKLSKYKRVDSGGRHLNNIGGPVDDKLEFQKDYKFSIAFENSAFPGYLTEKLPEAVIAQTLPIYWGDKLVHRDFNTARFLNYPDFGSDDVRSVRGEAVGRFGRTENPRSSIPVGQYGDRVFAERG